MRRLFQYAITGLGCLTLSYAQSVFAGQDLFTVNVTSATTLSILSTKNSTYLNAGIKINSSNYSLTGVGTQCTMNATTGYCLFSANGTTPKVLTYSGTGPSMNITMCLDGASANSCQAMTVSTDVKMPRFLYVVQEALGSPSVAVCALDTKTGYIKSCADAQQSDVLGQGGQGIVLNNKGTIAYITSELTSDPQMFQCAINSLNGVFSSCAKINIASTPVYYPYYGMPGLSSDNSILYLANYDGSNGGVIACPVEGGLVSSACTDTGATGVPNYTMGITLNAAQTKAYIASSYGSPSAVSVCDVAGETMSNCGVNTGDGSVTFQDPAQVAFNPAGTIAYVSDTSSNTVYGCSVTTINASAFQNCFEAAVLGGYINGIVLNKLGTMAYITSSYANDVYQCPIIQSGANAGKFGSCVINSSFDTTVAAALGY